MFGLFVDSIGGGPLVNFFLRAYFNVLSTQMAMFLRAYFDVFHHNSSRFNFGPSNYSSQYSRGPLMNVFLRAYFDVFRHSSRFKFGPSNLSSFSMFFEFC